MKVTTIFGPPGTGKTRTLVDYARAEEQGLFLSYTRTAAAEAVSRLANSGIRPSTLHSLAFNGLGMNRASVVDKSKLAAFGKASGIPFKGSERGSDEDQEGDEYRDVLSYSRNMMIPEGEAFDHFGQPGTRLRFDKFVAEYEAWKLAYGYMDFDDMLTLYTRKCKGWAKVVYLDEAQDCTPLQWTAMEIATQKAERVYIAGDDDQAIYEWNGADPHGMINFSNQFDAEVTVLEQSHRLTEPVLLKAKSVIETIERRVNKEVRARGDGPEVVGYRDMEYVLDYLDDAAPRGALLLMRDGYKLKEVQRHLNKMMVPYDTIGQPSPWTSKAAQAIRNREIRWDDEQIPLHWREFYRQADLSKPVLFTLSTIHSAKGREHATVILDLECPTRVLANIAKDRDAEVRVQYVGLTRAKEQLILCASNPLV